jgi:aminobenzoyl-glutamate utilization protein B
LSVEGHGELDVQRSYRFLAQGFTALAVLAAPLAPVAAELAPGDKAAVIAAVDKDAPIIARNAQTIWGYAETGFHETKSSALLQGELRKAGFTVEAGVAGMPTAFVARFKNGAGPVVAILAEFDALPGLSQEAVPERKPIPGLAAGHACGHHLFGAASIEAAIAASRYMKAHNIVGEVRVYGSPAEEGGSGKVYMVRAGLFKDVDVTIHWHAGDRNTAVQRVSQANMSGKFRFYGKPTHAAASPQDGRSALDAVEVMDYAVNMMREHVPDTTRIHYIITNGGQAPNVVPEFAEVYYYVRHNDYRIVQSVWERVRKAGEAAAMATETRMEVEQTGGVYALMPNDAVGHVVDANLRIVGGEKWTPEERAFAETIYKTLNSPTLKLGSEETIQPYASGVLGLGSSDVGDVSWVTPTAGMRAATWGAGTPGHSWQAVAYGGMGIGSKGAVVAAKTLALSALDLLTSPEVVASAKAELARRRPADFAYKAMLGDRPPALDYRGSGGAD